ncbi:aminoacyl-tRNA hydrolase [Vitreimonas flagellata]|uniref:aminoacyl-tRNA hydrolase n=1 Tax=Vitreimonas flagellata TaxID=2560861 RepID=UPI0010751064|nr:aminoacyl-tRNA hydrolase [Vitreimonas flagellata]
MLLLVGLGNPGPKYAGNRHNIGFMAVDAIARAHGFGPWKKKFQGELAEGHIDGVRTLLLKPQTFMNESGRSVGEAANFHKLNATDIVVFYDEIDLAPGRFRMKTGGGAAGHNGIRSMIASSVGEGFRRARMGVGHPGQKELVHHHVLSDFHKADTDWLQKLLDACAKAAPLLAKGEDEKYQGEVMRLAPAEKVNPRQQANGGEGA